MTVFKIAAIRACTTIRHDRFARTETELAPRAQSPLRTYAFAAVIGLALGLVVSLLGLLLTR